MPRSKNRTTDTTGTTPQLGLSAEVFEKAYLAAGIAYGYELLVFLKKIKALSEKLGRSVSVLEIGVGTGRVGVFISGLPWVSSYLGIDSESTSIKRCKKKHPHLAVKKANFILIEPSERWDVIVVPYTMFPGIQENRQEIMFLKMLHHGRMILVDTILPDAHGETTDVHFDNDGQELGLSFPYHELFRCLGTFKQWVDGYNKSQTSGRITSFSFEEYIFAFPHNGTASIAHHMLCLEK